MAETLGKGTIEVHREAGEILFTRKSLSVRVTQENPRFCFQRQSGQEVVTWRQAGEIGLLEARTAQWLGVRKTVGFQITGDAIHISASLEDSSEVQFELSFPLDQACQLRIIATPSQRFSSVRLPFYCEPDERFYGGGERFTTLGLRGQVIQFWVADHSTSPSVNNTYFPVPFVFSNLGYGFWMRTACMASVDFAVNVPDRVLLQAQTVDFTLEIYLDPDPLKILDLYTQRSGRPIAVPRWNWGFWHVSLGGERVVLAEAQKLRDLHIPCSALWVYDAFDPVASVGWPINARHHSGVYPDIRGTIQQLHAMGYKVQTYLFPYFYTISPHFTELEAKGFFLKNPDGSTYLFDMWSVEGDRGTRKPAAIFDFTNPAANQWWRELMRYIVSEVGYDGWMHDFGEYTPDEGFGFDGRSAKELHNAYPVLCQQTSREGCDLAKDGVSFYARCGFAGSQNWLTGAWNGDQVVSWDPVVGYPCTITACLSLSLSGMPYVGPDIGGYMGLLREYPADCDSRELWIRWTQFAAFTPLMRDHLGDKPDGSVDLWTDQETIDALAFYSRLHTALTPYWEIWARQATRTGAPIMRHLCLIEPDNPLALDCEDEYLLGEDLLVAPVVSAGARSRKVYFPEGDWVSYWDATGYAGGQEATVPSPLSQIPLFVRSGALIPTLTNPGDTLVEVTVPGVQTGTDDLEIRLFLADSVMGSRQKSGKSELNLVNGTRLIAEWGEAEINFTVDGSMVNEYSLIFTCPKRPQAARIERLGSSDSNLAGEQVGEMGFESGGSLASLKVSGAQFKLLVTL